ncbi:hypothetical protein HII36_41165 [Nonomuraea sp. NN258]|uniref:hypothetical protein n=1 Tax=Nonomuraea antri TaxID=2730852 RepID=UPI001569E748|nr:hypothetical protein [Nonomuraea antri]NRQ38197.1 hypothetical protein [Nonomuraea antri]
MAQIVVVGAGVVGTATGLGFARVFVAVPTPTGERGLDPAHLIAASHNIAAALRRATRQTFTTIVYRSTVLPGTTRRMAEIVQAGSGARLGGDFGVAYNPEYLRQATAAADFAAPPLITLGVVGDDERSARMSRRLYGPFDARVEFAEVEAAELQKYVHNLFNAVKISFFNEMRAAAARLGVADVDTVFQITASTAEGMRDPVYGVADLGPYGGACLPKDTAAWLAEMRRLGIESPVVAGAQAVNLALGGR